MKKTLLLTAVLILGTIATMAQTNALSFTIYPDESGSFNIFYSTKNAPSTNVMEVNWGDGNIVVYNNNIPTGSNPNFQIMGTVSRSTPIKLYSNCIDAIWIQSKSRGIRCEANNPSCQFIYYFYDNLSPASLEALYMSLNDGSFFGYGELHLSDNALTVGDAGDNILNSNAFIATTKSWRVCSWKAWSGTVTERMHWSLSETLATTYLKPAIKFKTSTTANMTDLQIGIMDSFEWPWVVYKSMIRIDDGTTNNNSLEVLRYTTEDELVNNAPKLTIKGTGTTGEVKIYGAMVSHFKTDQISFLDLTRLTNLRYLRINNCDNFEYLFEITKQTKLEYLNLNNNAKLSSVNVSLSPTLKTLLVAGCSSLKDLYFSRGSLEFLDFSRCVNIPRNKLSTLSDATKLSRIYADNLGWDACDLNALYNDLRLSPPSPGIISVNDASNSTPSNDWEGSNKTIATAKGWNVSRWAGAWVTLTGNGGGCTTGISQTEAAKFITVFPNPATDIVNITLVPNLKAEIMEVIDITGKTVFSVPVSAGELEYQINVSGYAKGMYLIRVGNITHKLLVK